MDHKSEVNSSTVSEVSVCVREGTASLVDVAGLLVICGCIQYINLGPDRESKGGQTGAADNPSVTTTAASLMCKQIWVTPLYQSRSWAYTPP